MKAPTKVKIDGKVFQVQLVVPPNENSWGTCDHKNLTIKLNNSLPLPRLKETLLHEILHSIYFSRISPMSEQAGEEQVVEQMTVGMMNLYKDNKGLKEFLHDD